MSRPSKYGVPLASTERTMKKYTNFRIGADGVNEMVLYLEKELIRVTKAAEKYCLHRNKKTIKREDVYLAWRQGDNNE